MFKSYSYINFEKILDLRKSLKNLIKNVIRNESDNLLLNSATSGILLVLRILMKDLTKDEILVPNFLYPAILNCNNFLGKPFKIIPVDITDRGIIDLDCLVSKINNKTRMIYWIHFSSYVDDSILICKKLCNELDIILFEDSCHLYGYSYKNNFLTTIGDISIISFSLNKQVCTYKGGILFLNSKKISYQDLLKLSQQGNWYYNKMEIFNLGGINIEISYPTMESLFRLLSNFEPLMKDFWSGYFKLKKKYEVLPEINLDQKYVGSIYPYTNDYIPDNIKTNPRFIGYVLDSDLPGTKKFLQYNFFDPRFI